MNTTVKRLSSNACIRKEESRAMPIKVEAAEIMNISIKCADVYLTARMSILGEIRTVQVCIYSI